MNKLTSILCAVFLLLTSFSALAATWTVFTTARSVNDTIIFLFDADTVEKSRNSVTLWIWHYHTKLPSQDGSWSVKAREHMNCSKRTTQTLAIASYDKDENIIKSYSNYVGSIDLIFPGSIEEEILKVACEVNFPHDTSDTKYFKIVNNDIFQFMKNISSIQVPAPTP